MMKNTATSSDPELINASELAKLLSLSVRTVWRLKSAGKLPKSLQLGRSVKWQKNEIVAWLESKCPPGSTDINN